MGNNSVSPAAHVSKQMTIAFLIALGVGAVLIPVNPFAPCIPMSAYALLGFLLTKDQQNSDRFADSLYYLGFLLTLIALLMALLSLPNNPDPLNVARALGAGLSASILGLLLRVLVVQFRGTVSDQEEEAQESIEEQATKVKAALQSLEKRWVESGEVLDGIRQNLQEFRIALNEIHRNSLITAQQRQKQLLESTARAAETWETELKRIRESLARVDIPPTLAKDAFAKIARDVGQHAAEVAAGAARAMEGVTTNLAKVSEASNTCVNSLNQLGVSLQEALTASSHIGAAVTTVSSAIGSAGQQASAGLIAVATGADRFEQSVQTAVKALNEAISGLGKLESNVQSAAQAMNTVAGDIKTVSDALVTNVQAAGTDIGKVREATTELVELARTELAKTA